jgi:hypothetical protein
MLSLLRRLFLKPSAFGDSAPPRQWTDADAQALNKFLHESETGRKLLDIHFGRIYSYTLTSTQLTEWHRGVIAGLSLSVETMLNCAEIKEHIDEEPAEENEQPEQLQRRLFFRN